MNTLVEHPFRSLAALAVLVGAVAVGVAEGFMAGLVFLLVVGLFLGFVTNLTDMLLAPFNRRNRSDG